MNRKRFSEYLPFLDRRSRRAHTRASQSGPASAFHFVRHNPRRDRSHAMRRLPIGLSICFFSALLLSLLVAGQSSAQERSDGRVTSTRTFRPVVRGTQYAVSSMKPEATRAAARVLESGGN